MSKNENARNQHDDVLEYLMNHDYITQLDAYTKFPAPITRLSAVIFDLRKKYDIQSERCLGKNCYGRNTYVRYFLVKEN